MNPNENPEAFLSNVKSVLLAKESPKPQQMQSLADQHSVLVDAVNRRLSEASERIKSGLICEAIHLIERAPNALATAAELELGSLRKSWDDYCMLFSITTQEPRTELAIELNRVYNIYRKCESQIRLHRLLALSRAPLLDRIKVVQGLLSEDPMNPAWKSQLRILEKARLDLIDREIIDATERSDLQALRDLLSEVESKDRTVPAPMGLVTLAKSSYRKVRRTQQAKQIQEIEADMHDARARSDFESARVLLQTHASVSKGESSSAAVESIRQWVEAQEQAAAIERQFAADVEVFDCALDDGIEFLELERLYAKLARYELPIPELSEQRFRQKKRQLALERSRRYRIAAMIVLGIAGITTFVIVRTMNRRATEAEITKWVVQIQQHVQDSQFEAAAKLVTEAKAKPVVISTAPELVALFEQVETGLVKESERRIAFAAALEEMKSVKGFDYNSPAIIARAKALVSGEAELRLFNSERERLEEERNVVQEERDGPFRVRREALEARLAASRSLKSNARSTELKSITEELDKLLETKGISEAEIKSARITRDTAAAEASTIAQTLDREKALIVDLDELPNSARSIPELVSAYRAFIDRYPDSPQASKLDAALKTRPAWERMDSFYSTAKTWTTAMLPETAEGSGARSTAIKEFTKYLDAAPDKSALQKYLETLDFYSANTGDISVMLGIEPTLSRLSLPWVDALQFTRDKSGRGYYAMNGTLTPTNNPPFYTLSNHIAKLDDLSDVSGSGRNVLLQPASPSAGSTPLSFASISKLAADLKRAITNRARGELESIHLELADLILQDQQTDPILRLAILVEILELHDAAGMPRDPSVKQFLDSVIGSEQPGTRIIDSNWLDTSSAAIQQARELSSTWLKRAPDFRSLSSRWNTQRNASRDALAGYRIVGLMWPNDRQELTLRLSGAAPEGHLYVVKGDAAKFSIFKVGAIDASGKISLTESVDVASPVFTRAGVSLK